MEGKDPNENRVRMEDLRKHAASSALSQLLATPETAESMAEILLSPYGYDREVDDFARDILLPWAREVNEQVLSAIPELVRLIEIDPPSER